MVVMTVVVAAGHDALELLLTLNAFVVEETKT